MGDFGNIIATDIIIMQGRHEFKVPKSYVEGYNGSEVFRGWGIIACSHFANFH